MHFVKIEFILEMGLNPYRDTRKLYVSDAHLKVLPIGAP